RITDDIIKETVNEVLQLKDEKIDTDLQIEKIEEIENLAEQLIHVKKINSINKLSNIGLLNRVEPIKINGGLNVFYGKNGSGKSSVYMGLCKALGHDKTVFSNINKEQKNSSCEVVLTDSENNEHIIEWETDKECTKTNVQIFDSQISNFIVQNDQLNQFELAHLKTEYFPILHTVFDKTADLLQIKLDTIKQTQSSLKIIISNNAPIFLEKRSDYKKEVINSLAFTEEEQQKLVDNERKITLLKTSNQEAVIKNINSADEQVKAVLNTLGRFGKIVDKESDDIDNEEGEKIEWLFTYNNEYFIEINEKIEEYAVAKITYEQSGENKLSSLVPTHWISNTKWDLFITKSIEFLNTLEIDDKKKYTDENCPYCQQPLETKEAKELLKIYYQIRDEHKEKLDELENEFVELSSEFSTIETSLNSINNKLIEEELKHIGISEPFEKITPENVFTDIKNAITSYIQFENSELVSDKLKEYWNKYLPIHKKFLLKATELNELMENKNEKIDELDEIAQPFRNKKALFGNKETILNYIDNSNLIKTLENKLSDLTKIKRATSTCETQFAGEVPLKIFKVHLEKEYEKFKFKPPDVWDIGASTHHIENRRWYSIGDKRVGEIFSEGERKIHSLADFFAQLKLNNFKGVFIFDDPVNSLDEERIEYVRNRIMQLVDEGNQVIVFTHNLVFLNCIVDTATEKVNLIKKLTNQVVIETDLKLGTEVELKRLFKEIQNRMALLAKHNQNDINIFDLKNIYSLMSGYLESFVELKVFRNIVNRYRPNVRMNSLDKMKDFETEKLNVLIDLYKQTSRKGSRHSQPIGVQPPKYSELKEHFEILKTSFNYN
ncbi:MAG: AAA family ATPase, partial [Ignavibacteriae bacterium]|nr:AAA family ATPase [Ignavibacteriota bacterium]